MNVANEILLAAERVSTEDTLVFVEHPSAEHRDLRFDNNPTRWDAPKLNLNRARAVRHEEIRLGRSMTPAEQEAHIRKLCEG